MQIVRALGKILKGHTHVSSQPSARIAADFHPFAICSMSICIPSLAESWLEYDPHLASFSSPGVRQRIMRSRVSRYRVIAHKVVDLNIQFEGRQDRRDKTVDANHGSFEPIARPQSNKHLLHMSHSNSQP